MPTCVCAKSVQSCLTLCHPMDYITHQALLSMGFSRQEYWSGLPFHRPTNLPKEAETHSLRSACTWEVGSLTLVPPGKPTCTDGQMTSQSTD